MNSQRQNSMERKAKYRMWGIVAAGLIGLFTVILGGYMLGLPYFGMSEPHPVEYAAQSAKSVIFDPATANVIYVRSLPHVKSLWDWLDLLVVPGILVTLGYFFNIWQRGNSLKLEKLDQKLEYRIEASKEEYETLQEYVDRISDIFVDTDSFRALSDGPTTRIARIRTLAVLTHVKDGGRRKLILSLLRDLGLVQGESAAMSLRNANFVGVTCANTDLSSVNLSGAILKTAKLRGATLQNAFLRGCDLSGADLSNADLSEADLQDALLTGADLGGAILHGTSLEGVKYDQKTVWPSGFSPPSCARMAVDDELLS